MSRFLVQSAMEYLMTYGWAILIIAVVLGAFFGLGFFNAASLAPKITSGACQVYRPDGPGTTSFVNTEGTCNNELPQYVAQFNGNNGYVSIPTSMLPSGSSARSVFAWVYWDGYSCGGVTNGCAILTYGVSSPTLELDAMNIAPVGGINVLNVQRNGGDFNSGAVLPVSKSAWHFIGYTYVAGSSSVTVYVDGTSSVNTASGAFGASSINGDIGARGATNNNFNGSVADVQIYNASLSANEVTALYDEGIGGVPINLNSLVGWWPLNGNANDYSGNLNNANFTKGVVYTSSWALSYTAP